MSAPLDGARVAAVPFGKKLVTANVALSGRAPAGTNVPISANCRGFDCTAITFAGRDGRWSTRLQLMARKGHQRVTVEVAGVPLRLTLSKRAPVLLGLPAPLRSDLGGGDSVVVIGDSLAVGMAPDLQALLPGRPVLVDARIGRPLDEGMAVLAGSDPPRASFVYSLFTNDDPARIEYLDAAVRESVAALGPHGCAVWATIVRPKVGGRSLRRGERAAAGARAGPGAARAAADRRLGARGERPPQALAGQGRRARAPPPDTWLARSSTRAHSRAARPDGSARGDRGAGAQPALLEQQAR